jgi:hypothetical protein
VFPGQITVDFSSALLHADIAIRFNEGMLDVARSFDAFLAQEVQQLIHRHELLTHIAAQNRAILD